MAALRERHEVTVVAAGASGDGILELPAFYPPVFGGLMREMGFVFAIPRRRALEALFRRADVVHVQFPFLLGLRSAAIARAVGAPLVSAFHVQPENILYNVGLRSPRLVGWTHRLLLRCLYDRSAAVVCPSRFALEELRAHGLRAPAVVIPTDPAGPRAVAASSGAARHRGKILVLAAGRISRDKRLDVTIEGVRRSRHAARNPARDHRARPGGAGHPSPGRDAAGPGRGRVRERRRAPPPPRRGRPPRPRLGGRAGGDGGAGGARLRHARPDRAPPASAARGLAISEAFLFEPGDAGDLARRLDLLVEAPERLREAARGASPSPPPTASRTRSTGSRRSTTAWRGRPRGYPPPGLKSMRPNRPLASSSGPAAKKSASVGPAAAPFPKPIPHSPSMVISPPGPAR